MELKKVKCCSMCANWRREQGKEGVCALRKQVRTANAYPCEAAVRK